jgi:hypothetical protein
MMDPIQADHIARGESLIKVCGEPALKDQPELWRRLWGKYGAGLLAEEICLYPGRRPRAWYEFDCPDRPADGESEVEFLHRRGELEAGELEAIRRKAVELVTFDRGRAPERPRDNFIPPRDLDRFAARIGLLTPEERAVLRLDEKGVYECDDRIPRWEA